VAEDAGLKYVYVGNVHSEGGEDTHCPTCGKVVVKRDWFEIQENVIVDGKCPDGHDVDGVWG
jgi:pyruvate formate lyase activating enzyme